MPRPPYTNTESPTLTSLPDLFGLKYIQILNQSHFRNGFPSMYTLSRDICLWEEQHFYFPSFCILNKTYPSYTNHQSALKRKIQPIVCSFPSHANILSLHKQRYRSRKYYYCIKELQQCNDTLPTTGLGYSFYTRVVATEANKNVNWTNKRRCFNLFVELFKKNAVCDGEYVCQPKFREKTLFKICIKKM